ncbi:MULTISPECIES: YbjN domain-containing protein [unclassified Luteimonas]|uniref:YbjN domain-containing protein n=1 Tax=unclassified Luteimonas TaxID=2629088 RepID=UPI0018F0EB06|nr:MULTISPECIES: YbjN domain-containing protein [unclassified Luteimonas]MBJ6978902.1 YbjN domain-containing protein [Luteimonas sp. MC1895]MBJ6984943.1 YbjN domain-containing protein [Luteimonas sp. MC1750]QQO05617.1 YbjN domain-containing protein [Luteimonas sp. MC1750]
MHRLTAGLLAPLLALAAAPALADTGRGVSGAEAMAVLQAMELEPEMLEDSVGDPMIRFQTNGLNAYLNFYDCNAGRCGSLQLEVGLDLENGTSLQVANVYNTRYRYGRMVLDDEMDPFLHYDFEVLHADHAAQIRSQVEIFGQLLGDFTRSVGF